jgi:hypothetical protein
MYIEPFIAGQEMKAVALKNAQRDLQLYAKHYRKSKKTDFYGDRKAMVEDFRTFLYEEVGRMRETWYYQHSDLTMSDYDDIIEAMCAEFNLKMRLKPEEVVIAEMKREARLRRENLKEFDGDLELYSVWLTHKLFEKSEVLLKQVYGYNAPDKLGNAIQAQLVQHTVAVEMRALQEQRQKEALI